MRATSPAASPSGPPGRGRPARPPARSAGPSAAAPRGSRVGLDDVVGHALVGEAGQRPQPQLAAAPHHPEDRPGRPDLRPQAGEVTSASRCRLVAPTTWAERWRRRSSASMRPASRRRMVSRSLATAPSSFSTPSSTGVSRSPRASRPEAERSASAGAPTARRRWKAISATAASTIVAVRRASVWAVRKPRPWLRPVVVWRVASRSSKAVCLACRRWKRRSARPPAAIRAAAAAPPSCLARSSVRPARSHDR
jgi:hypothetical protein